MMTMCLGHQIFTDSTDLNSTENSSLALIIPLGHPFIRAEKSDVRFDGSALALVFAVGFQAMQVFVVFLPA
jgi:hypothetical protein